MADEPLYSSQNSEYERHKILDDQENIASSPLLDTRRPKRPPTVTPKRFTKFFTPRTTLSSRGGRRSKAGRQLRDITKNGANRTRPSQLLPLGTRSDHENAPIDRPLKRRKHSFDIASSPPQSSPLKRVHIAHEVEVFEDVPTSPPFSVDYELIDLLDDFKPFPQPVRRLRVSDRRRGPLERSFGGYDALSRGRRGATHCADWQSETANFVTTSSDRHAFSGSALPFCSASCNTNSLIAVGEEEGSVRLIDSSPNSTFSEVHVAFRPHHNAIMDITFSSDDYLLATASGDQTARIIDMHTQQTICIMSGHTSSVKQVRFQPSDDNIITTSSRDGSVQIWDMRCGGRGSVSSLLTSFARYVDQNNTFDPAVQYSKHTIPMASIHRSTTAGLPKPLPSDFQSTVSITSIRHLPNGREHLLLTASELNSSLKLWDLRNASRRGLAMPASSTSVPEGHLRTRHYGVNSMSWSTDGARLYTACRDGAIYAYSTNHLVLGNAPEMDASGNRSRMPKSTKTSVGPLYALRHPSLRIGSFYVKSSVRAAKGDKGEMLAVGSSDGCAIVIPTDERHLPCRERPSATEDDNDDDEADDLPSVPPVLTLQSNKAAVRDLTTYEQGTALIRGHSREVTSTTWTYDGGLVTLGDDFTARCWREDATRAGELRNCGEGGGHRWRCGWAEVDAAWDDDDG